MSKILSLLLALLICYAAPAQQKKTPDSLAHKSYAYFIEKLEDDGSPAAAAYGQAYLKKAKTENNDFEKTGAYKALLHQAEGKTKIAYADSMVFAAAKTADSEFFGSAVLTRGIVYYEQKKYQQALDAYLQAGELIEKGHDAYLKQKLRFNMAQIKYYLGFYGEAQLLFAECTSYFKAEGGTPYLSSLHSLGLCYSSLKKYELASATNELGLREAIQSGNESFVAYFVHSEGINQHFKKNYGQSLQKLSQALPGIKKNRHRAAETMAYFYMAKSHLAMGSDAKALPLLEKVDQAFFQEEYIRPDLREAYELLIRHHRKKKDMPAELYYVNRLLHADSIIDKNFRYLSRKMHKQFDSRQLLNSKKELERQVQEREIGIRVLVLFAIIMTATILMLALKDANRRKIYDRMMDEDVALPGLKHERIAPEGEIGISSEVVAQLLIHLEKFENGKKFLEKDLSITRLAQSFNSNTKYVARVILHCRGMKYIDYVNSLKIGYILKMLKENRQARNFTLKALAGEAGFNTAQHFTTAFLKHVGISATYFIEKLKGGK